MSAKILLTGSSGNLGTYLLNNLVHSSQVVRIWCLNRSPEAGIRQADLLTARGLSPQLPAFVEFHAYDVTRKDLGLPDDVYKDISSDVTHILHAAWPVDWNKAFSSFEGSVRGVSNLIDLTVSASLSPRLFFVSSVAATGNWGGVPGARETVPEAEIEDWKVARLGYGQSKLVAERLLAEASRADGISVDVCRIGQVAGPVESGRKGMWPMQEWLPSLIASSRHMGILPATLGPGENVDWVPVDLVSRVVVDLLLGEQKPGSSVFHHITNPNVVRWGNIVPVIQEKLHAGGHEVTVIDLVEWVHALEESAQDEKTDLKDNPAVKLLSFFQTLKDKSIQLPKARAATLEVKHTTRRSPTMASLQSVNARWMSLWMDQWQMV